MIDPEHLAVVMATSIREVKVVDPGDHLLRAGLLAEGGSQQVHLVDVRRRDHHVSIGSARIDQDIGTGTVSDHGPRIDGVAETTKPVCVAIDHRDGMTRPHQNFGRVAADFSGSADDDAHDVTPSRDCDQERSGPIRRSE